ncbi:multiple sugar transport system permease protein/arabinogalactan oligomer / maltooligosaccharide transport system permease protein [Halomicrobium zhouii]|uniref:Multiple sugar transport system permease protein/arabinogalactan oligomer / maltooligosaccharide transport system permease protein n=1 Tax=Halomicrobium zhouii TaxID=767519 RepID=A0A1I6KDI4_9EURY|nr:carbohydrate ABC transporter permease [Halomicrobium zhouii]SFR89214.1 multiple sugar transport system permease protein/arabinogalactan oligomer / maltooligosaccharide transport system permease protein [Halomicrobium zhouii]
MATETDAIDGGTGTTSAIQRFDEWLDEDVSPRRALAVYAALGVFMLFLLLPVLYMILATFTNQTFLYSSALLPSLSSLTIANYVNVLSTGAFQQYFVNSTIIATATTALTLSVGTLAAYSLSRFDYPGRGSLLLAFLGTQMLPYVLILIPFFLLMYTLDLINSHLGIIIAHSVIALPLAIWLLKGYFDDIPESLDEAAKMDGCSQLDVLARVILPLSLPGLAVAGFYTFTISWNDFLLVSVLSQTGATRTLPYGLQLFQSQNQVAWHLVLTAATITMVPVIVLFAAVQQWVVKGLASGGMKGA